MLFPSLPVHNLVLGRVTLIPEASLNTVDVKSSKVLFGRKKHVPRCWECENWPSPRRQLQHRASAEREPSISSTSFTIWYVVYCQVWNIAGSLPCTSAHEDSFNSPRQCEVYRIIITGAWETVTVTLGAHWILFLPPCQSRLGRWERLSWWCVLMGDWVEAGKAWGSQTTLTDLTPRQSAAAPFRRCLGADLYFGCKLCWLQYWSLL